MWTHGLEGISSTKAIYALVAYPSGIYEVVNTTKQPLGFVDHMLDAFLICHIELQNPSLELGGRNGFARHALMGRGTSGFEVYICADDGVHAAGCHC